MSENEPKDPHFEDLLRAHVRQNMETLGFGPTKLSEKTGYSQGYISHWLRKDRGTAGISALFFCRLCTALQMNPQAVFFGQEPAKDLWRPYAPRQKEGAQLPSSASTPAAQAAGPQVKEEGAGGRRAARRAR